MTAVSVSLILMFVFFSLLQVCLGTLGLTVR